MATNPTLLTQPIAANGAKNVIPNTTSTAGAMSQDQGFPAETALPLGAGGVAPSREDFNGAFNLLSGIAFMAQKGFVFNFDNTQDYYVGCVVVDTTDGKKYECIVDAPAGTGEPHETPANWKLGADMSEYTKTINSPMFNKRDVITTSGTYTAPITGWYKITVKGGGGGGGYVQGGTTGYVGGGGGEGGTSFGYKHYTAGTQIAATIGAGGTGANASVRATKGGDSSFDGIVGGGGYGGYWNKSFDTNEGRGGSGDIVGCTGGPALNGADWGTQGGGSGGGTQWYVNATGYGGGGAGGTPSYNTSTPPNVGGAGYQGVIYVEYFDSSLNP